jgi:hypothetical protein
MRRIQTDRSIFLLVALMVVITAVILINRSARFFEPRTAIGYLIYVVFAVIFFTVIIAVIRRITDSLKTKNQAEKAALPAEKVEPKEKE